MRLYDFIIHLLSKFYLALFSTVFLVVLLIDRGVSYFGIVLPIRNILILPLALLVFLGTQKWLNPFLKKQSLFQKRWIWLLFSLIFLIQCIFAYSYYFYTGWDAKLVRDAAFMMVEHLKDIAKTFGIYYSYHINQLILTVLLGKIFTFFYGLGLSNYYFGAVVLNVLLVNLASVFIVLSVRKITKSNTAIFNAFWMTLILMAFSPWITIPYSDTFIIFIPSVVFYLYLNLKTDRHNLIIWFFIIILSLIGFLIKPQSIIVLIAIFSVEIFQFFVSFSIKKIIHVVKIILLVLISNHIVMVNYYELIYEVDFGILYGRAFTYTHYLMMGLNPDTFGVYSEEDTILSYQTGTIEERQTMNWSVIQTRLSDMGFLGYLDFSMHKLLINYNDGTFAWGGEGGFYVERFEDKTVLSPLLKDFYHHDGRFYFVYSIFVQGAWLLVLLSLPFAYLKRKHEPYHVVLMLSLIGSFFFVHLFEARARYLFNMVPIYIMSFAIISNDIIPAHLMEKVDLCKEKWKRLINK